MKIVFTFNTFKTSEAGVTAIEFALLAPLLFYIFMAIFELSLLFFASVNIDGAAIDAARRIRTGQTQNTADPLTDFTATLCAKLTTMIDCASVDYDVRTVSNFSAINLSVEYDPVTGEPVTYGFNAGGAEDIVVVRVMYNWVINTPAIGALFETFDGTNTRLLMSTVVFQNEPYE